MGFDFELTLLFSGPDIDSRWVFVDDLVAGVKGGGVPQLVPLASKQAPGSWEREVEHLTFSRLGRGPGHALDARPRSLFTSKRERRRCQSPSRHSVGRSRKKGGPGRETYVSPLCVRVNTSLY